MDRYRFAIFLSIVEIILLSTHLLLYEIFAVYFGPSKILFVVLILLSFSFLAASSRVRSKAGGAVAKVFYKCASWWLGLFLYLLMAGCLAVLFISSLFAFGNQTISPTLVLGLFFGAAVVVTLYGIFNARTIKVRNVQVLSPKIPSFWLGKKIVFLSDTHFGHMWGSEKAKQIASLVKDVAPEMVLFAGDFFDGVRVDALSLALTIAETKPSKGIYFVEGNHETYGDHAVYIQALKDAGIRVLENESVDVEGMLVAGAGYTATEERSGFQSVLEKFKVPANTFSILMKHTPYFVEDAERAGFSLMASGHTHQGQMFPFNLVTKWMYKGYDYGFKKYGTMDVLVSSGAGTWGPPLRIGTATEIVVISL